MNNLRYKYRYRPYDPRENQIREESRTRQIRKQLRFSNEDYKLIENQMINYGINSFSEYIRYCIYNKNLQSEELNTYSNETKNKRKQICFNDEDMKVINDKMKTLDCNNFNQFITIIALA